MYNKVILQTSVTILIFLSIAEVNCRVNYVGGHLHLP